MRGLGVLIGGALACLACIGTPARADVPAPAADPYAHAYAYAPRQATAADRSVAERSGPAIVFGLGGQFAGVGTHLAYYIELPESRWALVPYAGAGWSFGNVGPTLGAMGMYGAHNRFVLDAGFGATGSYNLYLHGEDSVASRLRYAARAGAGYEWMARGGLLVRILGGISIDTDRYYYFAHASQRIQLSIDFGLGHKLW